MRSSGLFQILESLPQILKIHYATAFHRLSSTPCVKLVECPFNLENARAEQWHASVPQIL